MSGFRGGIFGDVGVWLRWGSAALGAPGISVDAAFNNAPI